MSGPRQGLSNSIRMAVGAKASDVVTQVVIDVFAVVLAGLVCGMLLGIESVRFIEGLLFEVRASDPGILVLPIGGILTVALLAALTPAIRAVRIDPVNVLRLE